ncbi:MAG: ATP-binding protein [Sumerlaeia bacterium]
MSRLREKRLLSSKAELFDCMDFIRPLLEENNVPQKAIYTAELVLEEIVTNVFRYGFVDPATAVIEVELGLQENRLDLCFKDNGIPFNPTESPEPSIPLTAADAPIGGLGLKMIRKSVSTMHYKRLKDENSLEITIEF